MKPTLLLRFLLAGLFLFSATGLRADEEQDLIATLQSTAGAPQKWAACQKLKVMGTAKAVPALAALLPEEGLSQAARHVLETLPAAEAGAALREALNKTTGLLKAGVIDSLGRRGDLASMSRLVPYVSDSNPVIASAAAVALGKIGGREAAAGLEAARDRAPGEVQTAVQESLLKCAAGLSAHNDDRAAMSIYQSLLAEKYALPIRTAAWRGLVLSDSAHRNELVMKALAGGDAPVRLVALKLIRELNDPELIHACVSQWASLPPNSQVAVLEAQVNLGAEAIPTARDALKSQNLPVRLAGLQALRQLNDLASIPALAKAASASEPAERQAARDSLEQLHGPGASEAFMAELNQAAAAEKLELVRVLGERGERSAANVLLQNAGSDAEPVRLAALESLKKLAAPETLQPLLKMAASSKSDDRNQPVLQALYAVCEASPNKEEASRTVVQAMDHGLASERRALLPLLANLGTSEALTAAQAATRSSDADLAKEAVRVLSQWPNAAPAKPLLEIARASTDPTLKTLALRGAIQVAAQEPNPTDRLALLEQAMASATRLDEKKQVLGQLGQVPAPEALDLALKNLTEPGLVEESALAALAIAEKLAPANPDLADQAARKVLAQVREGDVVGRAWALRRKPSSSAPFIRNWVVCGPYRQAGVIGATSVFNIPFAPEKPASKIEWKTVSPSDHVNLTSVFPGQENCAAYLRTRIIAPEDSQGLLLIGSDDGVKVWLNDQVIHSHNVDRGEVPDQDIAPIKLKKGTNELLLKVTQGGGGWSACARIVSPGFEAIPGLRVECPTDDGR